MPADAGDDVGRYAAKVTDFDRNIFFLLTALTNKLSAGASRRMKQRLGLGVMEWRVVATLGAMPGAAAGRIAEVSGVDRSVVSRAVSSLQERALLARSSTHPADQASLPLALTGAGRRLHDRGVAWVERSEDTLLTGFSAGERDQLIDFLKRLSANLPRLGPA